MQFLRTWLNLCAFLALAVSAIQGPTCFAFGQEQAPTVETPANTTESGVDRTVTKTTTTSEEKTEKVHPTRAGTAASAGPNTPSEKPSATETTKQADNKLGAVIEEPPVYYVRDKEGRLVPLLGFSYEDIVSLMEQKKAGHNPAPAPQGYSLEQLVITGDVVAERAELVAEYKINLTGTGWADVPLWNSGAVLREPATYRGAAEHQFQYDSQGGGYTVRLRGAAGSQEEVTLKLIVPIKNLATQHKVEADLPTAAASTLSLRVPQSAIDLVSHSGCATAEVIPQSGRTAKNSEIMLRGLGGRLELAWQDHAVAENATAVLEAIGQVFAEVASRGVQFDTVLTVRGFGSPFDRFHIKLPPGAQLVGGAPAGAGYSLSSVKPHANDSPAQAGAPIGANPAEPTGSQWVEVQLAQPTAEPVEVHIQAERAYDVTKPITNLQLAGFEVREAAPQRQWGHIAVAVAGDWQIGWDQRDRVRQVAEVPAALQRRGMVAGFEYFSQPASLTARLSPRRTRTSVESEYIYFVEPRQLSLQAKLKYNIRGGKTSALEIAMPGWEIDEVGPANVVDGTNPPTNHSTNFSAALLEPTSGEVEITIQAHRNLAVGNSRLEISPPVPVADVMGLTSIAVVPADNVRLKPVEEELQGLVRPSVPPRLKLPIHEQAPLIYRAEQTQATFVADMELLPQVMKAGVQSNVTLGRDEIRVEQRFTYHVEHEPTTSISFEVPRTVFGDSHLEWALDDQPLAPSPPENDSADPSKIRIEVPLPGPRLGTFEVVARYRGEISQWIADSSQPMNGPFAVPLVMPMLASLDHNSATIDGESAMRVQPLDETWKIAEESPDLLPGSDQSDLHLTTSQATPQITLSWKPGEQHESSGTVVDRAWIQTWISGNVRQDRAVYRFSTSGDQVSLKLPAEITAGNLEVRLDRRFQRPAIDNDGTIQVKMQPGPEHQSHLLEIRYQWHGSSERSHFIDARWPHFAEGVWVQRIYWQLVLPSTEHLIFAPGELTPEFNWKWSGLGWGRQASLDQAELEKWSEATTAEPLPDATNRYLFSAMGSPVKIRATSAARWQIVLVSAAAALAVGLLLLYVPLGRKAGALLAIGIVMLALSASMPDAAVLFVQAAMLGLGLVVLAGLLRQSMSRRRAMGSVISGGSSSSVERNSSIRRKSRSLEMAGAASTSATETLDIPAAGS